jgi:hypothetical protein
MAFNLPFHILKIFSGTYGGELWNGQQTPSPFALTGAGARLHRLVRNQRWMGGEPKRTDCVMPC